MNELCFGLLVAHAVGLLLSHYGERVTGGLLSAAHKHPSTPTSPPAHPNLPWPGCLRAQPAPLPRKDIKIDLPQLSLIHLAQG
ncbi:unnamed protein product [Arctogadus glacialis]